MEPRFSDFAKARMSAIAPACAAFLLLWMGGAMGMQVTGYSAAANDRFQSGFPTAPVPNGNGSFVGAGRDWSGAAWASTDGTKGFGFLSPRHYLVARHYSGAAQVRVFDQSGVIQTGNQTSIEATNFGIVFQNETVGDLSLGTTTAGLKKMSRYGVLDLNTASSTNSPANYSNLAVFLYGRGPNGSSSPRLGNTTISSTTLSGNNTYFTTPRTSVQLETGDSGSPTFANWTNPAGVPEAALVGNNAAVNDTFNFHNFLGAFHVINRLNELMNDEGYAVRVVGNPISTWIGGSGSTGQRDDIARGANWSSSVPQDNFALFNRTQTSWPSVDINSSTNLRGLYFTDNASAADPFTFNGTSTLTIGRGGVTNYDNDRQVFNAPLALGDHQYWDAGSGGVAVSNIATNGRLLEIRAGPQSLISGNISGNGSLALESGTLTLNGTSSLTGTIWVHDGNLRVNGSLASVASVRIDTSATLSGSGRLSHLQGAGTVAPGASKGILRAASINPASGLDFAFEFSQATTVFGNATSSGNDLLRLDSGPPFSGNFTASNSVGIFLDVPGLQAGQKFTGGFFTDQSTDFFDRVQGASFTVYLRDSSGNVTHNGQSYSVYSGPLEISIATTPQTANFGAGDIAGRILEISVADTVAAWAETAFPEGTPPEDRLPDADPNNDGVVNWIAYALRLDPLETPSDQLPKAEVVQTGEEKQLLFQFRRNRVASDVIYRVEVSDDLVEWFEFTGPVEVLQPDPDGDGGAEVVAVAVPIDSVDAKKFVRLRALAP